MTFRCESYVLCTFAIAAHTRCGDAGIAICETPIGARALTTAAMTAGMLPTVPASPIPLMPKGLILVGTGL